MAHRGLNRHNANRCFGGIPRPRREYLNALSIAVEQRSFRELRAASLARTPATRTAATKTAIFSHLFTAGSPKVSIRRISERLRCCWTSW